MTQTELKRLGVDHRPDSKWLRSEWQKLGSYLHAAPPRGTEAKIADLETIWDYPERILKQLEPYVEGVTFSFVEGKTLRRNCCEREKTIIFHESAREALCMACESLHHVICDQEVLVLEPANRTIVCSCNSEFRLPGRTRSGDNFFCEGCGQKITVVLTWTAFAAPAE